MPEWARARKGIFRGSRSRGSYPQGRKISNGSQGKAKTAKLKKAGRFKSSRRTKSDGEGREKKDGGYFPWLSRKEVLGRARTRRRPASTVEKGGEEVTNQEVVGKGREPD